MKKKKIIIATVIIVLVLAVGSFLAFKYFSGNKEPENNAPQSSQAETKATNLNDLTGLPIDKSLVNARPVCIMINNIQKAQPLIGVSKADIMYECLVEGGITRIMACFKDPYNVDQIGSIRSARPYYIDIASSMDGIYVHEGGSTEALDMLKGGSYHDATDFSLGAHNQYMWRDEWRKKNLGYEHSVLTSGEKLKQGISDLGFDTKYKSGYSSKLKFSDKNNSLDNGETANKLTATFSNYKTTTFDYDSKNQTYLISQFGTAQKDGNTQNSKQNVIAFYIPTYTEPNSDKLQQMDLVGSGEGYYLSHGKAVKITWHKDSVADSPFYYTTSDGKDLVMYPGQTYVCCVPTATGKIDLGQ